MAEIIGCTLVVVSFVSSPYLLDGLIIAAVPVVVLTGLALICVRGRWGYDR